MDKNLDSIPEFPLEGKTVLLLDDEKLLRQIVTMMLEELGASVLPVESGEQAIDTFKNSKQNIDIVILDLRMSGMDGLSVYKQIKALKNDAKIALSSGISPDNSLLNMLKNDGSIFIEKPYDIDKLAVEIFRLLNQK
ncbi:MAG: response regulator [Deltaproteobacteria bacterium]|nr:response regulator [Deltaproteobacteria bacterium]